MKHAAVAWSFSKSSSKGFYENNKLPGPGSYSYGDLSFYKTKAPHWKLGTSKRSNSFKYNSPGPGNYEIKPKLGDAPKYTIRPKTGTNFDLKNKEFPGPGNYNPDVQKKNDYKFSMRIRPNSATALMNNPGPGAYNLRKIDSDLLKQNAPKFGTEQKHKDPAFTYLKSPAPGTYNYDKSNVVNAAPKFSFGKEGRSTQSRVQSPGPGQYEAKPIMGKDGPKLSMSFYRPLSAAPKTSPGPGAYEPSLRNKNKSPEYKIGTSKREIVDKETRLKPGPGTYMPDKVEYVKEKQPQWKFGSEQRGNMNKSLMNNPGPGNYEFKTSVGVAPKYTLSGKTSYQPSSLTTPGPGTYNSEKVNYVKNKEPSWRIGTSSREDLIKKIKREGLPGPGNYNIPSRALEGRKYNFGKEKRGNTRNNFTPGPGQYHIPCTIVDVPKYQTYSSGFKEEFRFI